MQLSDGRGYLAGKTGDAHHSPPLGGPGFSWTSPHPHDCALCRRQPQTHCICLRALQRSPLSTDPLGSLTRTRRTGSSASWTTPFPGLDLGISERCLTASVDHAWAFADDRAVTDRCPVCAPHSAESMRGPVCPEAGGVPFPISQEVSLG